MELELELKTLRHHDRYPFKTHSILQNGGVDTFGIFHP